MGSDADKIFRRATKLTVVLSSWTAKQAYKVTKFAAKTIYNHRNEIAGTGIGIARGTVELAKDVYGHTIREEDFVEQLNILKWQSERYKQLTSCFYGKSGILIDPRQTWMSSLMIGNSQQTLIDSLMFGADFTSQHAFAGAVPEDVLQAYELAYPRLAESKSLLEVVNDMDDAQLQGLAVGIKGKLFEIKYADYLNNGHLPDGYSAQLAETATNPGWDIEIVDNHGVICEELQLKATDSLDYIKDAFEKYPYIDIVTTDEVYSHIAMQGFSEHVINSGIDDQALTDIVNSSLADPTSSFDLMPSIIPFAVIAFSVSMQQDLTNFQKGKQFGERSAKSYATYLAGGAVAVATHTWWLGLIATVGSRVLLGIGRNRWERLYELKNFVSNNEQVLRRMELKMGIF